MLKEPVIDLMTKAARLILAGPSVKFRFDKIKTLDLPEIKKSGIYIHVPFCKQLCPYCPYNRIPYKENLAAEYVHSLIREIKYYAQCFRDTEITSIYIGGGTPTLIVEDLDRIVESIRHDFRIVGPLCIETNPADLTKSKVSFLNSLGFDALSLGVQSFNRRLLNLIGRRYTSEKAEQALEWIKEENFKTVNVDLMFALPDQSIQELEEDLEKAIAFQANQITAYPLFTFAYSSVGQYRKLKNIEMPKLSLRRRMYYFLYDYLVNRGYRRTSVWSFNKDVEPFRYSSVTRERYIGLGPSSASFYGTFFTLNTFSVNEYTASVKRNGHSVALEMPFTPMLRILYDFYWRLYDTYIPIRREIDHLTYNLQDTKRINLLVRFGELLGMIRNEGDYYSLTRRGAFWIHLMQNYFALRYINTIWGAARLEAWPAFINF